MVEHTMQIYLVGVEHIRRFMGLIECHGQGTPETRAQQMASDRIHPVTHQTGVTQLLAILPAASPRRLCDLLSVYQRRSPGDEKTAGGAKSSLKCFRVRMSLHRDGPIAIRIPATNSYCFQ